MSRHSLILGSLLLVAWASIAQAADEEGELQAVLEVTKGDSGADARQLQFTGVVKGFPVGTRLDIRFGLRGNNQHISWYRALVDDKSQIKGSSTVLDRTFAPGVYEVQFWLKVATQSKEVRKWFVLNRGWSAKHQELLENVVITVGTKPEQLEFLRKGTETLRNYLGRLKTVYTALDVRVKNGKLTKEDATWAKEAEVLGAELLKLQDDRYLWEKGYIALPLEKYRQKVTILNSVLLDVKLGYENGAEDLDSKILMAREEIRFLEDALSPAKPLELGDEGEKKKP